jgi:hypothetical protein
MQGAACLETCCYIITEKTYKIIRESQAIIRTFLPGFLGLMLCTQPFLQFFDLPGLVFDYFFGELFKCSIVS